MALVICVCFLSQRLPAQATQAVRLRPAPPLVLSPLAQDLHLPFASADWLTGWASLWSLLHKNEEASRHFLVAASKWQSWASRLSTATHLKLLRNAAADQVFLLLLSVLESDSLEGVGGGSFGCLVQCLVLGASALAGPHP